MKAIKADADEDLSSVLADLKTIDENIEQTDGGVEGGRRLEREALISALESLPCGLCAILKETVREGIAYHHSGLTAEERKLVEDAYRKGTLRIIVATSTLSTGINLPAKAVVFNKPYVSLRERRLGWSS